jgi:hypothetical protein
VEYIYDKMAVISGRCCGQAGWAVWMQGTLSPSLFATEDNPYQIDCVFGQSQSDCHGLAIQGKSSQRQRGEASVYYSQTIATLHACFRRFWVDLRYIFY